MANITTRNDPLQELDRFDPFREIEPSFWPASLRRIFRDLPSEPAIKLDVTEDDKAYTVKAELPGVKKEDIDVQVEGNQVSITAEVKRESEEKKGEKVLRRERYQGVQSRSFSLARDIDRAKVEARFADGVLELTLPKNGGAPLRRIAIQ